MDEQQPVFVGNEQTTENEQTVEIVQPQPIDATPAKKRPIRTIVLGIIALVCVVLVIIATQLDYTAIVDDIVGADYQPTPELASIIDSLELTEKGTRILKATHPDLQNANDFNQNCLANRDGTFVLGCYANNSIYIYNIEAADLSGVREATLAHEFLHAVWSRMSHSAQQSLEASLKRVSDSDEEIQKHIDLYDASELYNELHSVVGAQVPADQLPEDLRKHYAEYFSDQTKIAKYYDQYNSIFKTAEKRIEELTASIEEHRTKLTEMQKTYTEQLAELSQDISDFNARARNGNFDTVEQFDVERRALIERQTQLQNDYQTITKYVEEANSLINEYNNNIARKKELQESMNSTVVKPTTDTTKEKM